MRGDGGERRTVLSLVRHGETSANVEGVWHGSTDSALTERGRAQACCVADHLAATRSDAVAVYASPLARARHTAEAIGARLGIAPRILDELREYHLGAWEGISYSELETRYRLLERMRQEPDWRPGGGESPRQVAERIAAAWRAIAASHPEDRVIVVGHGGAMTLGLGLLVDGDVASWRRVMDNCAVSDLALEPQPTLLRFNERHHLPEAEGPAND